MKSIDYSAEIEQNKIELMETWGRIDCAMRRYERIIDKCKRMSTQHHELACTLAKELL